MSGSGLVTPPDYIIEKLQDEGGTLEGPILEHHLGQLQRMYPKAMYPDLSAFIAVLQSHPRLHVEIQPIGEPPAAHRVTRITLKEVPSRKPGALDLEHIFMYHAPGGDDVGRYQRLREAAKAFAQVIVDETPECADQSAAIRHVREAVMTANAAIALKGRLHTPR